MQQLTAFETSYSNHNKYPQNLVVKPMFDGTSVAYQDCLKEKEATLFQKINNEIYVRFREPGSSGALETHNVYSDQELEEWITGRTVGIAGSGSGSLASRKDPICRFIFLQADNSRVELKVTRRSLERLLSYHQVMPEYISFISVFGRQEGPADPLFSDFCEQTMLGKPISGLKIDHLGRSGRYYQLCYNFKAPGRVDDPKDSAPWSIRQAAFHHQFDVEKGTTLWLTTRGGIDLYERVKYLTDSYGRLEDRDFSTPTSSFRATLPIHLLHASWASEQWKPYVRWLTTTVEHRTGVAVYGERSQSEYRHDYTPDKLRLIQFLEDDITLTISVLDSNLQVMVSLRDYYLQLLENKDFDLKTSCRDYVGGFAQELNGFIKSIKTEHTRVKFLVKIVADRKNMILQWLQSQENEKISSLSVDMRQIAIKSHRETIGMSIITGVTLIYLPATFVSIHEKTFFSTDVVKYQDSESGNFSFLALMRWLEVTVPLTFVTLVLAGLWFLIRKGPKKEECILPRWNIEKS